MAVDPAVARGEAEAALVAGAPERAVAILAAALGYPAILDPAALAASLGVLARAMVALGHTAIAEHAAQASLTPGDADAYYQLGYELIEVELTGLAATVLTRGLVLAPGEPAMVTELVSALERELAYADARAVLEAHPELIERDCLCGYLTAWNAIMSGDVAAAEARVPRLVPTEPAHHVMIARLRGMLARAAVVRSGGGLGPRDLRGWHYVTTGGLLLERSPYGLDQPMHGRYAYLNDAPALVARGLDGLVGVLARWGLAPPCVFAAPGPGHAAIAAAAAARLGVAVAPWPMVGAPAPGLVVAGDLAAVAPEAWAVLAPRRAGQCFYAHRGPWTQDGPVSPDVVGLLCQLATPLAADAVVPPTAALDDFARGEHTDAATLAAAIGPPDLGTRERWWAGGPVPSARFR